MKIKELENKTFGNLWNGACSDGCCGGCSVPNDSYILTKDELEQHLKDYYTSLVMPSEEDIATLIKFLEWYLDDGITVYDESEEAVDEFFKQSLQD